MDKRAEIIIANAQEVLGFEFEDFEKEKLTGYVSLLLEWNQKINLISRKSEDVVLVDGIVESYALYSFLEHREEESFADIGAGGGIPGMIVAILKPDCKFTLIDSVGKKMMVLQDIKDKLSLDNVTILNKRLEEISKEYAGKFDVAFSRGVGKLEMLMPFYFKIVNEFGSVMFLTGNDRTDDKIFKEADIFENPYFDDRLIVNLDK